MSGPDRNGVSVLQEVSLGTFGRPKPVVTDPISVLLADGHQLFAQALATTLQADPGLAVVGGAAELATASVRRARPDVLLVSYFLMLVHRAELAELRAELPELKVLVLVAALDEEILAACVQAGAVGCVTKQQSPAELIEAIRRAHAGEVLFAPELLVRLLRSAGGGASGSGAGGRRLTPREREVLGYLAAGLGTAEIAERMVISAHTVRAHLKGAIAKLEVRSKLDAVLAAVRSGLIEPPRT